MPMGKLLKTATAAARGRLGRSCRSAEFNAPRTATDSLGSSRLSSDPTEKLPQGKISQPGPFAKRDSLPSPRSPGWGADNTPRLPQHRELHNRSRRKGNKHHNQPPPALLGVLVVCELLRVCELPPRVQTPSPLSLRPKLSSPGHPGGAESSCHPWGFVPKVGDAPGWQSESSSGRCRSSREVSHAQLLSWGGFAGQGDSSQPCSAFATAPGRSIRNTHDFR